MVSLPRPRRPYLLPADRPPAFGCGRQRPDAAEVRAGVGLGEELAPARFAVGHRRQVRQSLLVRPVGEQDGGQHLERHRQHLGGDAVARLHLSHHLVLPSRRAVPAVFDRPRATGEPGVEERPPPVLGHRQRVAFTLPELSAGRRAHDVHRREVAGVALLRGIALEPRLDMGAELLWPPLAFGAHPAELFSRGSRRPRSAIPNGRRLSPFAGRQ